MIDAAEQGSDGVGAAEAFGVARYLAPEHGEVVVVTQDLSETVRPARERAKHGRLQRSKQLELMAKISGLLPPLVQMLDAGGPLRRRESPPSSSVDSLHPVANARPCVFHIGPIIEADERVLDGRVHGLEGVFLGEDLASNIALMADQLLPHVPERSSSRPEFLRVRRLVER